MDLKKTLQISKSMGVHARSATEMTESPRIYPESCMGLVSPQNSSQPGTDTCHIVGLPLAGINGWHQVSVSGLLAVRMFGELVVIL